jgi:hypothetical protein
MNRLSLFLAAALVLIASAAAAQTEMSRKALSEMSTYYRFFRVLSDDDEGRMRYVYADDGPHLHVYAVEPSGQAVLDWQAPVGSAVRDLQIVATRTGDSLIVAATEKGKVLAYDADDYHLVSENLMEPFVSIQAMAVAQLDEDETKEVILLGVKEDEKRPHLFVYDGASHALEWRSQDTFAATEILVANLDDDPQPEIILNTGMILDSRFHTIEINATQEGGFGVRIRLLDVTGDGVPEIFGEGAGQLLRIYDVNAQRRIW